MRCIPGGAAPLQRPAFQSSEGVLFQARCCSPESPPPPRGRSRRARQRRAGWDNLSRPARLSASPLLADQQALCRVAARGVRATELCRAAGHLYGERDPLGVLHARSRGGGRSGHRLFPDDPPLGNCIGLPASIPAARCSGSAVRNQSHPDGPTDTGGTEDGQYRWAPAGAARSPRFLQRVRSQETGVDVGGRRVTCRRRGPGLRLGGRRRAVCVPPATESVSR